MQLQKIQLFIIQQTQFVFSKQNMHNSALAYSRNTVLQKDKDKKHIAVHCKCNCNFKDKLTWSDSFSLSINSLSLVTPKDFFYITAAGGGNPCVPDPAMTRLAIPWPFSWPIPLDFPWYRVVGHIPSTSMQRNALFLGWGKGSKVEDKHVWSLVDVEALL